MLALSNGDKSFNNKKHNTWIIKDLWSTFLAKGELGDGSFTGKHVSRAGSMVCDLYEKKGEVDLAREKSAILQLLLQKEINIYQSKQNFRFIYSFKCQAERDYAFQGVEQYFAGAKHIIDCMNNQRTDDTSLVLEMLEAMNASVECTNSKLSAFTRLMLGSTPQFSLMLKFEKKNFVNKDHVICGSSIDLLKSDETPWEMLQEQVERQFNIFREMEGRVANIVRDAYMKQDHLQDITNRAQERSEKVKLINDSKTYWKLFDQFTRGEITDIQSILKNIFDQDHITYDVFIYQKEDDGTYIVVNQDSEKSLIDDFFYGVKVQSVSLEALHAILSKNNVECEIITDVNSNDVLIFQRCIKSEEEKSSLVNQLGNVLLESNKSYDRLGEILNMLNEISRVLTVDHGEQNHQDIQFTSYKPIELIGLNHLSEVAGLLDGIFQIDGRLTFRKRSMYDLYQGLLPLHEKIVDLNNIVNELNDKSDGKFTVGFSSQKDTEENIFISCASAVPERFTQKVMKSYDIKNCTVAGNKSSSDSTVRSEMKFSSHNKEQILSTVEKITSTYRIKQKVSEQMRAAFGSASDVWAFHDIERDKLKFAVDVNKAHILADLHGAQQGVHIIEGEQYGDNRHYRVFEINLGEAKKENFNILERVYILPISEITKIKDKFLNLVTNQANTELFTVRFVLNEAQQAIVLCINGGVGQHALVVAKEPVTTSLSDRGTIVTIPLNLLYTNEKVGLCRNRTVQFDFEKYISINPIDANVKSIKQKIKDAINEQTKLIDVVVNHYINDKDQSIQFDVITESNSFTIESAKDDICLSKGRNNKTFTITMSLENLANYAEATEDLIKIKKRNRLLISLDFNKVAIAAGVTASVSMALITTPCIYKFVQNKPLLTSVICIALEFIIGICIGLMMSECMANTQVQNDNKMIDVGGSNLQPLK